MASWRHPALPAVLAAPLLLLLESSQQVEKFLRKGSLDEIVVVHRQRPPDRVQNLRIERGNVRRRGLHAIDFVIARTSQPSPKSIQS